MKGLLIIALVVALLAAGVLASIGADLRHRPELHSRLPAPSV